MSTNSIAAIEAALTGKAGSAFATATKLLAALGYESERTLPEQTGNPHELIGDLPDTKAKREFLRKSDTVHLIFQITDSELGQASLFVEDKVDPGQLQSYVFIAVALQGDDYSRTSLARMTRLLNKQFPMPVMVLFGYGAEESQRLSIAIINRRRHRRDKDKEVLGKVTLIHEINMASPHRGHLDILDSFSIARLKKHQSINNFDTLHAAWEEVFNVQLLNKRFYRQLSDWYFWALSLVQFPDDVEKDAKKRNATSLIRLLTRLIFCWFLKEKGLIPSRLFQEDTLGRILKSLKPGESTFYHAILQNLFFATLNQKMGTDNNGNPRRKFAKDGGFPTNRNNHGLYNLYRYESLFQEGEEAALEEFADIPFLNGGLFECLDHENENSKVQYVDGFSRNPRKQARVPNELFFGEVRTVDLSEPYADKTCKNQRVGGLIPILNAYKFTIVENTPVDQEIALDPELLGMVFENLLASYNPETQTTARKQTGSFYTPRPIVDYMVDESLKAHLAATLTRDAAMGAADASTGLEILFTYTEKEHPFNPPEVKALIQAIDNCKILDPACGSGAFPMGVLHKLVFILQKLDPENEQWKQRQIETAEKIADSQARDSAIQAIERDFAENELDYGRKLYLIENCLYGVDIQPIAIQIAKLRFFISLVCDQKVNRDNDNHGIQALPNLETRFVAADTLIGLPSQLGQMGFHQSSIVLELEKKLKNLRHQHFAATTRRKKIELQGKDKECREALADELFRGAVYESGNRSRAPTQNYTRMLADWDPYNATAVAKFFDSKWMFSLDSFHLVIGNPPYIQLQKDGGKLANSYQDLGYKTFARTGDIYQLFYEKGCGLLGQKGVLCYITSNSWLKAKYGEKTRQFFSENHTLLRLLEMGKNIFDNAIVDTNIIILCQGKSSESALAVDMDRLSDKTFPPKPSLWASIKPQGGKAWMVMSPIEQSIMEKMERIGTPLKDWDISIYRGVLTGLNEAFIVDNATREALIAQDPASADLLKPILRGRDIKRYRADWKELWLIDTHNGYADVKPINVNNYPVIKAHLNRFWSKLAKRQDKGYTPYNLRNCAYHEEFMRDKLVWIGLDGNEGRFAYDDQNLFCANTAFLMTGKSMKYLCALLNSRLVTWFMQMISLNSGMGVTRWIRFTVENIPIPQIISSQQEPFINLLNKLFNFSDENMKIKHIETEEKISELIYELYEMDKSEIRFIENIYNSA